MALSSIPRVSPKSIEYVKKILDRGIHNARNSGLDAELEKRREEYLRNKVEEEKKSKQAWEKKIQEDEEQNKL